MCFILQKRKEAISRRSILLTHSSSVLAYHVWSSPLSSLSITLNLNKFLLLNKAVLISYLFSFKQLHRTPPYAVSV